MVSVIVDVSYKVNHQFHQLSVCELLFLHSLIALYFYILNNSKVVRVVNFRNLFKNAFRIRYSDPDLQVRVRQELSTRTQGPDEPVRDFVVAFRHILQFMHPPLPLEDQLTLCFDNMRHEYRSSFKRWSFTTFEGLELLGRDHEINKRADSSYRPPPPPSNSWFPEVAYRHGNYVGKGAKPPVTGPSQDRSSAPRMAAVADENPGAQQVPPAPPNSQTMAAVGQQSAKGAKKKKKTKCNMDQPAQSLNQTQGGAAPVGTNTQQPVALSYAQAVQTPAAQKKYPVVCFNCKVAGHL